MKKILTYIFVFVITTLFVFSMSACNNGDKVQSGKLGDLLQNISIEKIDYIVKKNDGTDSYVLSSIERDDCSFILNSFESEQYKIDSNECSVAPYRNYFIFYTTDGYYVLYDGPSFILFDSNAVIIKRYDFIYTSNDIFNKMKEIINQTCDNPCYLDNYDNYSFVILRNKAIADGLTENEPTATYK